MSGIDKVVYFKLTNACQLKCKHCYNAGMSCIPNMTDNVLKDACEYVNALAKSNRVLVIFHGGEPMLAGSDTIMSVIDTLSANKNISFTITTNLIYDLDDNKLNFFTRFRDQCATGMISTSYDFEIRFSSSEQEALWERNVHALQNLGLNVCPIVCVTNIVTKMNPVDVINKFKQLNITKMNFERLTETGRAAKNPLRASNREVDVWMLAAYKAAKDAGIDVQLFSALEEAILNNNKVGCRKRECQKDVITINPDGTIAGCPNCANNSYGNISGEFDEATYNALIERESLRTNECYLCDLYEFCNGECYQLRWDDTGCPGMIELMRYIKHDSI